MKHSVLVGTHVDKFDPKSNNNGFITYKEGYKVSKEIGASHYLETSSVTKSGVTQVFLSLAQLVFKNQKGSPINLRQGNRPPTIEYESKKGCIIQ